MRANVDHNHALHESALIVSIVTVPAPYVSEADRFTISSLNYPDDGISSVVARYGFQERPDVPDIVRRAAPGLETPCDLDDVTYFLSKMELVQEPTLSVVVTALRLVRMPNRKPLTSSNI